MIAFLLKAVPPQFMLAVIAGLLAVIAVMGVANHYAKVGLREQLATSNSELVTAKANDVICAANAERLRTAIEKQNQAVQVMREHANAEQARAQARVANVLAKPIVVTAGTGAEGMNKWLENSVTQ